jgi:hypothetical protein
VPIVGKDSKLAIKFALHFSYGAHLMPATVFPKRDSQCLAALQVFAEGIAADVSAYFLTTADATSITNAVNAFAAALGDAVDPATRTTVTIAVKSEMRLSAEELCRQYAILIKYNAGISDAAKLAIGVKPVNNTRTPINVPSTSPLLNIVAATPGAQTVRYADSTTPDSRKKPFGAMNLQLFVAVGEAPILDPEAAEFRGAFTKNPVEVNFTSADNGKTATYFARWASRRGEVGNWSLPVSMAIAA